MKELNQQKNIICYERKYFTQVPNYIADNSTAIELALYLQIKKYAGENGECFATEMTLMKKLHIGKKALDKAFKKLRFEDLITLTGKRFGKTRPINTYEVNDIWEMNTRYYENQQVKNKLSDTFSKDMFQKEENTSQKKHNISSKSNIEEEPYLIRTKKEEFNTTREKQHKYIRKRKNNEYRNCSIIE